MPCSVRLVLLFALAFTPSALLAQNSACANGRLVPYFGWDVTECTNCSIRGTYFEYLREPRISGIRSDGPAAGVLEEHDTLLAVDGLAITTPEAWRRMRDIKPGELVHFTVRGDAAGGEGATREETIQAAGRCVPVPPPARRIVVLRRKQGSI
jgi:hypothetical protein